MHYQSTKSKITQQGSKPKQPRDEIFLLDIESQLCDMSMTTTVYQVTKVPEQARYEGFGKTTPSDEPNCK